MTGLYRRKDSGIWWMNFTVKGKHYRRSTETRDKKLAEAILGKVKAQIIECKWFEVDEARQHTFEELMNRYLKEHSAANKTKESYGNDKNYVKHLSTSFAGLSLDKITPNRIAQYKSIRTAKGAKPQTVKHEMICLNHAFNLTIKEWEWATVNPVQRVKMPKVQNQIDRWLSYEEQDKLIEACYDREWLKDVIIFSLNTGMRQGEVINLKWLNVDLFRRTATVVKSKNGERRTVPLNQTVIDMLKAKSGVINLHGHVFTQDGEKVTKRVLQRQFATALKRTGIKDPFRWHDLRHSFATRLAQSGKVDIYAISKLLGHKDIRMTQRYAHHLP